MTPRADRLVCTQVIRVIRCLVLVTVLALLGSAPALAADATPLSKEAVEQIVRDYLLKHPEVVVDALRAMELRHREAAQQRSRDAIAVHERELLADPDAPVTGSATGDVTVVEFFDYRCTHCRRAASTVPRISHDASSKLLPQ